MLVAGFAAAGLLNENHLIRSPALLTYGSRCARNLRGVPMPRRARIVGIFVFTLAGSGPEAGMPFLARQRAQTTELISQKAKPVEAGRIASVLILMASDIPPVTTAMWD